MGDHAMRVTRSQCTMFRVSTERFHFWHAASADKEAAGSGASNLRLRRCSTHLFTPNLRLHGNPPGLRGRESGAISSTRHVTLDWAVYCVRFGYWSLGSVTEGPMWTLERFFALKPLICCFKKEQNRVEVHHRLQSIPSSGGTICIRNGKSMITWISQL